MGLGFFNRNPRKDFHVRSEVDTSLTTLLLNACSLMNKIYELITIVQPYKPLIVTITEICPHDQINDAEIAIDDYHIFRKDAILPQMSSPYTVVLSPCANKIKNN